MAQPPGRPPRTSVVVVSRHRPQALAGCLDALTRQSHPDFEIVLIADPDAVGIRPDLPLKRAAFDRANISEARNAGIALAAGEVIAFIDDDALAVPGWAEALTAPFADPRVLASTGFTRGPDGLSWQARAERMTPSGQALRLDLDVAAVLAPEDGQPISTIGTNCAFRRTALAGIGGFDPAFAYHLDESDVNMRMAQRYPQGLTAVVPGAQVIHGIAPGIAPGAARGSGGVPRDLTAIGRSAAIFAARHGGTLDWTRQSQRRRLLRHMVAGRLDPLAVAPLLATLEQGIGQGKAAGPVAPPPPDPPDWDAPPAFRPVTGRVAPHLLLSGWHWQRRGLRAKAARATEGGALVTILLLTPGVQPHRMVLSAGGWWEQRGGLWGASLPEDSSIVLMGWQARIRRERGNLLDFVAK